MSRSYSAVWDNYKVSDNINLLKIPLADDETYQDFQKPRPLKNPGGC